MLVGLALVRQLDFTSRLGKRIQERALRAVFNTNSLTYNELLCRAKLPT